MGVKEGRGEVAPAEFGEIFLRRLSKARIRGRGPFRRGGGPAGRDLAEAQMGGEARGRVRLPAGRARARRKEARRSAKRASAARPPSSPGVSPSASSADQSGAVGVSRSASIGTRCGRPLGPRRRAQAGGCGQGPRKRSKGAVAAPEGGECAGGRAVRPGELPRLAHEPAVEAHCLGAALAQGRLHPGVEGDRGALVASGPQHAAGAGRFGEGEDRPVGRRREPRRAALRAPPGASPSPSAIGRGAISPPRPIGRPFRGASSWT